MHLHARGLTWSTLSAAVSKAIEAAEPGVEFTRSKYLAAHNAVVASPTYGKAMGIAEGMVKRVQVRLRRPSLASFMGGARSQRAVCLGAFWWPAAAGPLWPSSCEPLSGSKRVRSNRSSLA